MCPGMEFLPGVIVESHFSQRGRHGLLICAVAQFPRDLGLGIDEDTAVIVKGNQLRVIGQGAVTIIDMACTKYSNVPDLQYGDPLAFSGLQLHVFTNGHQFDLDKRGMMEMR